MEPITTIAQARAVCSIHSLLHVYGAAIQCHPKIRVIALRHGGHCGFFHWAPNGKDPYWAENRIVDFQQERYRSNRSTAEKTWAQE
ncbi:MAG: hypothetical protein H7Y39_13310 [Nitrospiraceae bacterium]|nr:hypothetical protein [Nitrospiraceae bacterium]